MDMSRILEDQGEKEYFFEALKQPGTEVVPRKSIARREYFPVMARHEGKVEIDICQDLEEGPGSFYLGIDVGSTSTKLVLLALHLRLRLLL